MNRGIYSDMKWVSRFGMQKPSGMTAAMPVIDDKRLIDYNCQRIVI